MLIWLSLAAALAVALLLWVLFRMIGNNRIDAIVEKHRATSLAASRAELVDGNRHVEVAVAITRSTFFYENGELDASIELDRVREIDYDTELATGTVVTGGKVLRLRSQSQTFEFVLNDDTVARWQVMLPARRMADAAHP